MTPEEHSLLERTYNLAKENNDMIQSIRRSNRIATIARIAYWVVIIGISVGAYYVIQPFIDILFNVYGGNSQNFQSAADSLKDLLQ